MTGGRGGPLPRGLVERLAAAGCVAAEAEVRELVAAASGDLRTLEALVARRIAGEPLAWVTGGVSFLGHRIGVCAGVYVPRWQTEALVRRAIALLPAQGTAVDLCTGSGAIAAVLGDARPAARVVATDLDPVACACAAGNGVEVYHGHLADPLPAEVRRRADVVIAVVPYVPTGAIPFLPRDVRAHEPLLAIDGGPEGIGLLESAVQAAAGLLRPSATLLLELGFGQDLLLEGTLRASGFAVRRRFEDADGDLRGIEAVLRRDRAVTSPCLPPPEVPRRTDGGPGVHHQ